MVVSASKTGTSSARPSEKYFSITSAKSLNRSLLHRDLLRLRRCQCQGVSFRRGTMNHPSREWEWVSSKSFMSTFSSVDKTGTSDIASSFLQNRCKRSSPVSSVACWETGWGIWDKLEPLASTNLNSVSKVERVPFDPDRRPLTNVTSKMSIPRSTSATLGWPNLGSVSTSPWRWLQFVLRLTEQVGNLQVTCGKMMADTPNCLLGWCKGDT